MNRSEINMRNSLMRSGAVITGVLMLAGCQTAAERTVAINADLTARLNTYNGATMAQFTARTGLTPVDAYPVTGGRVFVVRGAPITLSYPGSYSAPTITNVSACQLLIQTKPNGAAGTADDWILVGTSRSGPCDNLPV